MARDLRHRGVLPETAAEDAFHIAVATVHGMDYLLTWNCRHIANARMRQAVGATCALRGYEPPVICTPGSLWETAGMWEDPIVEEVRKAREEHAARFHYDLDAIYRDLKAQDERDPRRVVSLPPKRPAAARRPS